MDLGDVARGHAFSIAPECDVFALLHCPHSLPGVSGFTWAKSANRRKAPGFIVELGEQSIGVMRCTVDPRKHYFEN